MAQQDTHVALIFLTAPEFLIEGRGWVALGPGPVHPPPPPRWVILRGWGPFPILKGLGLVHYVTHNYVPAGRQNKNDRRQSPRPWCQQVGQFQNGDMVAVAL